MSEWKPLRRVATCLDGKRVPLNRVERAAMQGSIPYWGSGGVVDYVDEALFSEPLVLLGEDGAPFFDKTREVAFLVNEPVWVNNHIHVLRPHGVDSRYLAYSLNAVDYSQYISGSTRDKLTQDDMWQIQLWLPELEEQRRIADFLDAETSRLDELSNLRGRQLAIVRQRGDAVIAGIIRDAEFKFRLMPMRWALERITQGWSPVADDREAAANEWAVLKTSAITSGAFEIREHKTLPNGLTPPPDTRVRDGDLLMVRGSGSPRLVGVSVVAEVGNRLISMSDLIYRLRPSRQWNAKLMSALLRSGPVRERIGLLLRGQSGQTIKLRTEDIRSVEIADVPPSDQLALLGSLESVDENTRQAASAIGRSQELLIEHRQALITAAVAGQLDVTTAGRVADRRL